MSTAGKSIIVILNAMILEINPGIYRYMLLVSCLIVMGKAEGHGENWHGHVTALTVAPTFRRLGLAGKLMNILEEISEK